VGRPMSEGAVFDPVRRAPRLSDTIAERLLEAIVTGQFSEGDVLPSERDLGTQFGVSRTVIREAIRSLATRGVVDVQSGRGVRVLRLDSAPVTEAMSLLVRGTPAMTFTHVHEVRTTLEVQVAGLAADRAGAEEIVELHEIVRAMEDAGEDIDTRSRLDVEFHRVVARSARNELFLVLLDSIGAILLENRRTTLAIPHSLRVWVNDHRVIADAIERRDHEGARSAMEIHLGHVADAWAEHTAASG
jgi:GntR family transcriptional regulator, transcriptional repressor for pyruvate dehydrogenase complex